MNSTLVDFAPLINAVALLIIPLLAAWLAPKLAYTLKLKDDAQLRVLFETAARNGLALAMSRFAGKELTIDLKNEVAAMAARYVMSVASSAIEGLKIAPAMLQDALVARIEAPSNVVPLPVGLPPDPFDKR